MSRGDYYTAEEDKLILQRSFSDSELAARFDRSVASVRSRRERLVNPEKVRVKKRKKRAQNPATVNGQRQRYTEKGGQYARCPHRFWTRVEEAAITADDRPADHELAQQLRRSIYAIQTRRSHLRRQSGS